MDRGASAKGVGASCGSVKPAIHSGCCTAVGVRRGTRPGLVMISKSKTVTAMTMRELRIIWDVSDFQKVLSSLVYMLEVGLKVLTGFNFSLFYFLL